MSVSPEEGGQGSGQELEDTTVASEVGSEESQGGGESLNPAWNDLLQVVPSMLHSQVTPHLQQWDKNYQDGINKVHSQYEPYKPYVDNNIPPDTINYALQVMQAIEDRPQDVIQALQQYTGAQGGAQTAEQGQVDDDDVPDFLKHPEVQRMKTMLDTVAQIMVQQNQTSQQAAEDAKLASELSDLREKHGEFDEEWVLTRAANNINIPLEQHVQAYKDFVSRVRTEGRRPPGPKVMPSGGSAPDNQVDTKSLDEKGRRQMIAQLLSSANQNS